MLLAVAARCGCVPLVHRVIPGLVASPFRLYSGDIVGPKKLNALGKRIMVIGGAFKNVADVPELVPRAQYLKCREKFRIKLNIATIVVLLAAAYYTMVRGRSEHEAGNSIHNQVLKRHADLKADAQKEAAGSSQP